MNFDCSVCWEPLAAAVEPNGGGPVSTDIVATRCGHLYHTTCLQNWLGTQNDAGCPTCRTTVSLRKCVKLYPGQDDAETRVSKMKGLKRKIEVLETDLKKANGCAEKERIVQQSLKFELNSKSIELDSVKEMLVEQRQKWRWEESYFIDTIVKLKEEKGNREVDLEKANADAEKERMVQKSLKVELNSKSVELDSVKEMLIEQSRKWKWQQDYFTDTIVKLKEEKGNIEVDLEKANADAEKERTVQKSLKVELNSKSIELDSAKEMLIEQSRKWRWQQDYFTDRIVKLKEDKEKTIVDLTNAKRQREVDLKKANADAEKERIVQKSLKVQLNSKSIELDSAKEMLIEQRLKWIREESNFIDIVGKLKEEKEKREIDLEMTKRQRIDIGHILLGIFIVSLIYSYSRV